MLHCAENRGRSFCGPQRKGSSQTLLNDGIIPRLTGRSCGEFPCKGRTLPSRRFLPIALVRSEPIRWLLHLYGLTPALPARLSARSSGQNSYSSRYPAARHDAWWLACCSGERLSAWLPGHTRLWANSVPPAVPPANHPISALPADWHRVIQS
jgi:hypothetical protein